MKALVEAIRKRPCLWNLLCKDYRNSDKKDAAWQSIVDELNVPEIRDVKQAKIEWKKLRDSHRDSLKRVKTTRDGQEVTNINTWKYADAMAFLLPFMKKRIKPNVPYNFSYPQTKSPDNSEPQENDDINDNSEMYYTTDEHTMNMEFSAPYAEVAEPRKRRADTESLEYSKEDLKPPKDRGAIDLFMESMAITIKTMPSWMQLRIKKKIFEVVTEAEEELEHYSVPVMAGSNYEYSISTTIEDQKNILPNVTPGPSHSAN